MPKGLSKPSSPLTVSFEVSETAPNTFTQEEIALQLDVLNNEIFVVVGVDLDVANPDALAGVDTSTAGSVTATSQTAIGNLDSSNTIATAREFIRAAGFVDGGVGFSRAAMESYTGDVDYIALIATNNFFVSVQGTNNTSIKGVSGKLYGYRAVASADIYAALVQSEVLSA